MLYEQRISQLYYLPISATRKEHAAPHFYSGKCAITIKTRITRPCSVTPKRRARCFVILYIEYMVVTNWIDLNNRLGRPTIYAEVWCQTRVTIGNTVFIKLWVCVRVCNFARTSTGKKYICYSNLYYGRSCCVRISIGFDDTVSVKCNP